jgi:signal transduction histidine kinase
MSSLVGVEASGSAARRGVRGWAADAGLFLLAAGYWLLATGARLQAPTPPELAWLFAVEEITTAVGCAALWLRRRWPVQLAVGLAAVSVLSDLAAVAGVVALFTVAVYRPPRTTAAVLAVSVLGPVSHLVRSGTAGLLPFLLGVTVQGGVVGWGLFIRHRRQLALSMRDRAAHGETEARLRAEQAQHRAREEIAREMHDVLGHRLSLLSVHAGALEFRPDAPAEDVARAAQVIRESAHEALQDLREVIGVLRAPVGELTAPTLGDVRRLVDESRRAAMPVELTNDIADPVPDRLGRTVYRIVQEGLTNARKHAAGARVSVHVAGAPGRGLTVEVRNDPPGQPPRSDLAPGYGLAGLAERVALAGGRLEHGAVAGGGWRLAAWLRWPA